MLYPDLPEPVCPPRVERTPEEVRVKVPAPPKPRPFRTSDRAGMVAYLRSIHRPGPGWVPEPTRPDQVETSRSMAF